MGLFTFFRPKAKTAGVAKERLQILVAHERAERNAPSYLPRLKNDLLKVIKKYVKIDDQAVQVRLSKEENCDVLELNIALPEKD